MEEFDAVIIGSGAGGAPLAHTLVGNGKRVLILEKGPLLRTEQQDPMGVSDYKRDELFGTGMERKINFKEAANYGSSFYTSHAEPDLNDEPHVYKEKSDGNFVDKITIEGYTAQVVGGGTQLYGGVSLRFTKEDFALHSFNQGRNDIKDYSAVDVDENIRDWAISYDDLEPFYCKAERLVGLNGQVAGQAKAFSEDNYQQPLSPNPISDGVLAAMTTLGMNPYRTPLAVITENHAPSGRTVPADPELIKTSFVNRYGDARGYKSSTWVSLLAPIMNDPLFELRPNSVVTHLEAENGKITKVHYRDAAGVAKTVAGKAVVVACSAIESVRLLLLSAENDQQFAARINGNGLLGKYFLTHAFGGAQIVLPHHYDKSIALDSDYATDFCATDGFIKGNQLWAGGAIYNNTSDGALPISMARSFGAQDLDTIWNAFTENTDWTGDRLLKFIKDNFGCRLSVAFMANQIPQRENRIELHPAIRDKWGRKAAYVIKDWHAHDKYLMDVLAKKCAQILSFVLDPAAGNASVTEFGAVYMAANARARIANHILGGARFGTDPDDSVLDPDCRAWNFDNLYVTDGSFMPTSGGANPTLTIQANSFRVGEILAARI